MVLTTCTRPVLARQKSYGEGCWRQEASTLAEELLIIESSLKSEDLNCSMLDTPSHSLKDRNWEKNLGGEEEGDEYDQYKMHEHLKDLICII